MSRALTTALLVLVLGAFVTAAQAEADVPKALDYLVASQNEDGSWGGGLPDLRWRDTGVALEALRRRGDLRANRAQALEFLRGAGGGGSDLLARRARAGALFGESATVLLQSLWSIRREATTDPASPNYPDGGWGLTSFYQTDVLDTSLVLQAFEAAGFANGLTAANEVLAVGEERLYTVRTPAAAGSVSAYFPSLSISGGSGSLNLWFVGPGGRLPESGWYVIGSPNTLVPWDGGSTPPFAPGLIEVHVRNDAGSTGAATFDLELSFTAGGIDSRDLREPVDYLRLAQDAGGGWGPTRGAPVQLFLSTHALLALEAFDRAFGTTAEVASGIAYLKSSANPDGGFGSEAGTSTSFETALAAIVLLQNDPGDLDGAGALSWLEPRQLPDGSWEQDPYRTGLALRAFDAADPDADGDLVVDPVDNCHTLQNGDQTDTDADGTGDVCDEDDDNDGVLDGASAGEPSNTPFLAADITGMTGTLPAQPPGAFINFQVFDPTQVNLGWWDATNQAWIEADVSPEQRRLAFFVDTNSCFCIDMNDGDTLTPGTDSGDLTIYLPDQPAGWQGWLYVADDGSTYFDGALTSLAKAAPTEPGDNCRVVFNPGQEDRDTDGTGDACDPNDGEVNRLRILADGETLSWTPEEEAIEYNLYRGFVSALSSSNYGSCLLPGVTRDANLDGDPDSTDLDLPPAGDAYTYLATAEMAGGEGSLGRDSSGMERANSGPCP